jgi:hypothetical protein
MESATDKRRFVQMLLTLRSDARGFFESLVSRAHQGLILKLPAELNFYKTYSGFTITNT